MCFYIVWKKENRNEISFKIMDLDVYYYLLQDNFLNAFYK